MIPKSTTWIPAGFILLFGLTFSLAIAARASPGDTLYVQSQSAHIYEAPSANTPVVMQVNQGQKLKEFRRQGEWVKVIIYGEVGKEGWIEGSFVGPKSLADTAAESQAPEKDGIVGAVETPKPKAKSLLRKFAFKATGRGGIKGYCRYKTANGAVKRFKIVHVNKLYRKRAKAIWCSVSSRSLKARLTVQLWGDGYLLDSKEIRTRSKPIPCGTGPYGAPRVCFQSTRRQLVAGRW
jgi:hypothetical protein